MAKCGLAKDDKSPHKTRCSIAEQGQETANEKELTFKAKYPTRKHTKEF